MKSISSFVCQQCGNETAKWQGRCPNCGEWNSLVETTRVVGKKKNGLSQSAVSSAKPLVLSQIKNIETNRMSTSVTEFDRVLGGGIVPGAVMLVAGDPGVGKSTLLLAILGKIGGLYVAGEESAEQVKLRAKRLGIDNDNLSVLASTSLEHIIETVTNTNPKPPAIVIDSIQTISSGDLDGGAGSVGQIRESTQKCIKLAKETQIPFFIIGHVTKEGTIAGPKMLEHMVDVVCYFEGERYYQGRILRAYKNRFGPTDEVGLFDMEESGLSEISNPSKLFLEGRITKVSGSAIGVTLEGTRPLLVEIQALVVESQLAMPRRVANGVDFNRLQVILAILQKRLHVPLGTMDVFVTVSGGMKLKEPAMDLPIALALISAHKNKPLPEKFASFGELGLLGEIKRTQGGEKRVKEAVRLGFTETKNLTQHKMLSEVVKNLY